MKLGMYQTPKGKWYVKADEVIAAWNTQEGRDYIREGNTPLAYESKELLLKLKVASVYDLMPDEFLENSRVDAVSPYKDYEARKKAIDARNCERREAGLPPLEVREITEEELQELHAFYLERRRRALERRKKRLSA